MDRDGAAPSRTLTPPGARPTDPVPFSANFSSDSRRLVVGGLTGVAAIYDVATGQLVETIPFVQDMPESLQRSIGEQARLYNLPFFAPDGSVVVVGWTIVRVYRGDRHELAYELSVKNGVLGLGGLADPPVLAVSDSTFDARVYAWSDGRDLGPLGDPGDATFLAGIPGTRTIVLWSDKTSRLRFIDATTGEAVRPDAPLDRLSAYGMTLTDDGTLLKFDTGDGGVRLVDVNSAQPIGNPIPTAATPSSGNFTHDGKTLIASGKPVQLWDVDPASWEAKACTVAGRNLTQAERARYLPADEPYRASCTVVPPGP
jgi:WD40 repeat protein